MSYVFVSYSRENQAAVRTLAQDIGGWGHRVWLDENLTGGRAWWDQILAVIRECDVFVFALSPDSLASPACKLEHEYARALGKSVVPVVVTDGVFASLVPSDLAKIQHVDYRRPDKQSAIGVLKALSGLPTSMPPPDPLPCPPAPPLSYLGELGQRIERADALTFNEQAALLVRLKEGLQQVGQQEEAHQLLVRLRKRPDTYARIDNEIEALLKVRARTQLGTLPPLAEAVSSIKTRLAGTVRPPPGEEHFLKSHPVVRGVLTIVFGLGPAVGAVQGMLEQRLLNPGAKIEGFFILWAGFSVLMWFVLPLFGRLMSFELWFLKVLWKGLRHPKT